MGGREILGGGIERIPSGASGLPGGGNPLTGRMRLWPWAMGGRQGELRAGCAQAPQVPQKLFVEHLGQV